MVGVRPDGTSAWGDSWAVAWRALVASRVVVLLAGAVAVGLFGLSPRHVDFDPAGLTTPFGALGDALVAPLARWDSVWFMAIAQDGYGGGAREAFFPLYPLLLAVGGVFGQMLIAGALLSTALAAAALTVLHRLVSLDYDAAVARGAVLVEPPHDWEYGERQAALDDPFGHQWVLNQTLTDVAPEEWGGESVTPRPPSS
jgi:hypothetical protein